MSGSGGNSGVSSNTANPKCTSIPLKIHRKCQSAKNVVIRFWYSLMILPLPLSRVSALPSSSATSSIGCINTACGKNLCHRIHCLLNIWCDYRGNTCVSPASLRLVDNRSRVYIREYFGNRWMVNGAEIKKNTYKHRIFYRPVGVVLLALGMAIFVMPLL